MENKKPGQPANHEKKHHTPMAMPVCRAALATLALLQLTAVWVHADDSQTERRYLSGHGPGDAVPWEFLVTDGRRAGGWATIPVPSNWELQGFGSYNYGKDPNKSYERGHYRHSFDVPSDWKGRCIRLVFDGVMTDTAVRLNGRDAGPVHHGGFTRFRYDITSLVNPGAENLLEVEVAKSSANIETDRAERDADYWVFGGIYRPVWLEALPAKSIEHVAIDARADGTLVADVTLGAARDSTRIDGPTLVAEHLEAQVLDRDGEAVGEVFTARIPVGGTGRLRITTRIEAPKLWTAETPDLYTLRVSRRRGDETLHTVAVRFGFRTFEVRDGEGLFLNNQRILLKGVNRHSFRPATGRALDRDDCYADVRLIRSMNMNAVRMSHYPPDEAFLEACDELGLYVLDELSGWQQAHGTAVGRRLVREMVERDVNHPSVIFWDNGNEGGWNPDLDGDFALYDPQQRRVLHPWAPFGGIDTKHYTTYDDHVRRLRGPNLVMPTEVLHALHDGGAGAGLEDYWRAIEASPFGAGAFIWAFADEGVVRTDRGGRIDVFGTFAPDGIVGPYFEKEGSFDTVRDIWNPVQIDAPVLDKNFDGRLTVHNRYDFTPLSRCRFNWRLVRFGAGEETLSKGSLPGPEIAPHASGALRLTLPENWREADVLAFTAVDPNEAELWTWTWPTQRLAAGNDFPVRSSRAPAPRVEPGPDGLRLVGGGVTAAFDRKNGMLLSVRCGDSVYALQHGPRLVFARPPDGVKPSWLELRETDAATLTRHPATPQTASVVEAELEDVRGLAHLRFKLEISPDGAEWVTVFDGSRRPTDGVRFDFPPTLVAAVRLSDIQRADGKTPVLKTFRIGHVPARYPRESQAAVSITSGAGRDSHSGSDEAWIDVGGAAGLERHRWTLRSDGSLLLDYSYPLDGDFLYHGITFDHAENRMTALRWLGAGPFRVWQNRIRGTWLGVHETVRQEHQAGESWRYPEFDGFFGGVRWARLATDAGPIQIVNGSPDLFLRVGTPRISHPNTTVDFPAGNLSLLGAIPAMGSKFQTSVELGPGSQPARATGRHTGSVLFRFGEIH